MQVHYTKLDKIFGIRGWGLILYGTLPSNLALLGALNVEIAQIDKLSPILILLASILPIYTIFILIRDLQKKWYLSEDYLKFRSVTITTIIILLATIISMISGIIHGRYVFTITNSFDFSSWTAVTESFIMAVISLVISSTFFVTTISKETDLPGLPPTYFVNLIEKLHEDMMQIKSSKIWNDSFLTNEDYDKIIIKATAIKTNLKKITVSRGNHIAKKSLQQTYNDVVNLISVIEEIKEASDNSTKQYTWEIYFDTPKTPDQKNRLLRNKEKAKSIENLRKLNLGD